MISIREYSKLFNPIKFKPNDFQKKVVKILGKENRLIITCGRQVGSSTILIVWSLLFLINSPDKTIGIKCHNMDSGRHFLDGLRQLINNVNPGLMGHPFRDSTQIKLTNGSKIKVVSYWRREVFDLKIIDNCVFTEKELNNFAPELLGSDKIIVCNSIDEGCSIPNVVELLSINYNLTHVSFL